LAADVGQQILFDEDPRPPDLRAGDSTSSGEFAHGFPVDVQHLGGGL
jgi:hypothetical protein